MNSEEVAYHSLRPDQREECLNLWTTVWPGSGSQAYFERYFYGDVEWLPYYTQVAMVDNKIVSAAHICKRTVACGDMSLTIGGIANVATLPEFRRKGYNTGCMQRAIGIMEADAMDFSLLFTGINHYYREFGFVDIARRSWSFPVSAFVDSAEAETEYTVRQAEYSDLEVIQSIYDAYNLYRPIAVRRSEAYWREWLGFGLDRNFAAKELLVAENTSHDVVGYVRTGLFKSAIPYSSADACVKVIEFGIDVSKLPSEADMRSELKLTCALVKAAAAQVGATSGELAEVVWEAPLTNAVETAIKQVVGTGSEIERSKNKSSMVRLLHPDNLFRSFAMTWNVKWHESGTPPGNVTFETPYGYTTVNAQGAFLAISSTAAVEQNNEDCISQSDFFELLFGCVTVEEVTDKEELYPLLNALFVPQEAPVFWGADGF